MQTIKPSPHNFTSEAQYSNFMDKWSEWLKTFEMAADGGCVEFH